MNKNKKIEELLDRWEEGNMSVKDLSDELYILFDVSSRRELLLAFLKSISVSHPKTNEIVVDDFLSKYESE